MISNKFFRKLQLAFKARQSRLFRWGLLLTSIAFTIVVVNNPLMNKLTIAAPVNTECYGQEILISSSCPGDDLSTEEASLVELINDYRSQNRLPAIPISNSLTLVANRHVRDLAENIGTLTHSWSNCDFNRDFNCMWAAPQRLGTAYPGNGYENAYGGSGTATAEGALNSWQSDPPHDDVIINQGIWKDYQWNALGVGIYQGYAVMWVGVEPDPP